MLKLPMNKLEYLNKLKQNNSEILYVSVKHILDKLYSDQDILDEQTLRDFFVNYKNFHIYLNDFAGVIYNKHNSSIDQIYIQMCEYLGLSIDNQYTLEHTFAKLEKQTPQLLLSIKDDDIKHQAIEHFQEHLEAIKESEYFKNNLSTLQQRYNQLEQNISLVKSVVL